VGSTSKPIGDMDVCWQRGYACMVPRQLRRGYRNSFAVKQFHERRDEEHTYVDFVLLLKVKNHGQTKTNLKYATSKIIYLIIWLFEKGMLYYKY
jgi:hypothetical protein